jgi:hypothetical protein
VSTLVIGSLLILLLLFIAVVLLANHQEQLATAPKPPCQCIAACSRCMLL